MARYSAEQWGEWIEQQQESGLSVVDFCEEVGVSTNSFYRWRAKLVGASSVAVNGFESVETASPFVAVSVVGTSGVEVELLCGAVVRAPADEAVLRCVFNALSSAAMDEADGGPASGGAPC